MSEIEVEEGEDDSGRATAAQGRDNIEWWRLLMTRPEAPPAVTEEEEEAARRAERRPSPLDRIEQRGRKNISRNSNFVREAPSSRQATTLAPAIPTPPSLLATTSWPPPPPPSFHPHARLFRRNLSAARPNRPREEVHYGYRNGHGRETVKRIISHIPRAVFLLRPGVRGRLWIEWCEDNILFTAGLAGPRLHFDAPSPPPPLFLRLLLPLMLCQVSGEPAKARGGRVAEGAADGGGGGGGEAADGGAEVRERHRG